MGEEPNAGIIERLENLVGMDLGAQIPALPNMSKSRVILILGVWPLTTACRQPSCLVGQVIYPRKYVVICPLMGICP